MEHQIAYALLALGGMISGYIIGWNERELDYEKEKKSQTYNNGDVFWFD